MKIVVGIFGIVSIAVMIPVTAAMIMDFVRDVYRICKGGR